MAFFGLIDEKKIGEGSVEEAHRAIIDAMNRIDPLLTKVFMLAQALVHGVLNRIKVSIHVEILPDPGPNPPPKEEKY